MTPEELLKPRFQVIADYPGNTFVMGKILTCNDYSAGMWFHKYTEEEPIHIDGDTKNFYPHCFKKLEWWEERTITDMPEFLKSIDSPAVYKIIRWDMERLIGYINDHNVCSLTIFKPEYGYLPATEAEFQKYQKVLS